MAKQNTTVVTTVKLNSPVLIILRDAKKNLLLVRHSDAMQTFPRVGECQRAWGGSPQSYDKSLRCIRLNCVTLTVLKDLQESNSKTSLTLDILLHINLKHKKDYLFFSNYIVKYLSLF